MTQASISRDAGSAIAPALAGRLCISVVSHGQGALTRQLLQDLQPVAAAGAAIIVTLNIPEDEAFLEGLGFSPQVLRNPTPLGFGANHNQAFRHAQCDWYAVVNPDIRCQPTVFARLIEAQPGERVGVVAPRVLSATGQVEDSARRHPSIGRLARRVWLRTRGIKPGPDYDLSGSAPLAVDWVAGMFLLFPASAYEAVGGFDERYFMYLEDADICRRLASTSRRVLVLPDVDVVHDARRASGRSSQHLRWHLASLARYLLRHF